NHAMRYLTPKGRCFADIQPLKREFGFSRRNAIIQPQVDIVLLQGLKQYKNTQALFSRQLTQFSRDADGVTLNLQNKEGDAETIRAQYQIACDSGISPMRRNLGIAFSDELAANHWCVMVLQNVLPATTHIYFFCDPVFTCVSATLPHSIRRFACMVMSGKT